MTHPNHKPVSVEIPFNDPEKMAQFQEMMNDANAAEMDYQEKVARELGVSSSAAMDICYLRTRSRWTQAKEDFLVACAKAGKKRPFLMANFDETAMKVEDMPDGDGMLTEDETGVLGFYRP